MNIVEKNTYTYRELKSKYPKESIFYESYESGDYYNTAKTIYYGENKKELEYKDHGYYG